MSIKSAQKAAASFKDQSQRLDCIIANAGIMATPYQLTDDGIESQFQTKCVAPCSLEAFELAPAGQTAHLHSI